MALIAVLLLFLIIWYGIITLIDHVFESPPKGGISIENQEYRAQMGEGKYLRLCSRIEKGRELLIVTDVGKSLVSYKCGVYKLIKSSEYFNLLHLTYKSIDNYESIDNYTKAKYAIGLSIIYQKLSKNSYYLDINLDNIDVKFLYKNNQSNMVTFFRYFTDEESIKWQEERLEYFYNIKPKK